MPKESIYTNRDTGFSFHYPADWKVRKQSDHLRLGPPPGWSDSLVFISCISVGRLKTVHHMAVRSALYDWIARINPEYGQPRSIGLNHKKPAFETNGWFNQWEQQTPEGPMRIRIYKVYRDGVGVILWAQGPLKDYKKRDKIYELMFESFRGRRPGVMLGKRASAKKKPSKTAVPKPTLDRRLFGAWHHTKTYSSGSFNYTSVKYRTFRSDGRFVERGRGFSNFTQYDMSGNWAGLISGDTGVSPKDRGRWQVAKGRIRLDRDNNYYAIYQYEASGRSMLFIPSKGANELWRK